MRITFLLIYLLQVFGGFSQQKYWVYVNNSNSKNVGIVRKDLENNGCYVANYSKWLNAFSINFCDQTKLSLNVIDSIRPVVTLKGRKFHKEKIKLGFALEQIGAQLFIDNGYVGKGVKIGIIDGGFLEADKDPRLSHLFNNDQIKAYRDFVTPALGPYEGSKHYGDDHGNQVWHMIAGKDPKTKVQFGIATGADFYLARTDDGRTDFRAEEDYLIQALEWMDSLGIKLVNISIGYSMGFENPSENYKPGDMDGKSVALTKAAQIAAKEKGMLLVVAGGNDGNVEQFKVVSTPADAKDVLTVGATGYKTWQKVKYSSIGAEFLDYIKPEVTCFSSQGTSFSAPIITGLAAAIWGMKPELINMQVKGLITSAGHLSQSPNNYLGFGVPDAELIYYQLLNGDSITNNYITIESRKRVKINVEGDGRLVIFHKKDRSNVSEQQIVKITGPVFRLKRPESIARTTVTSGKNVTEIIWKD